jgi:quinol monooxygenase YgiN
MTISVRLLRCAIALSVVLASSSLAVHSQAPADPTFYGVAYVDVAPSSGAAMIAAFRQYRDASRKDDGYVRFELFEQVGRPAHFVVIETWRDQGAYERHGMAAHAKQYLDALQPIRVSGYDQRPYKALASTSAAEPRSKGAPYVIAHVDIGGGPKADAAGMLQKLAEASRREAGNLRFEVYQHAVRANHFTVVEAWQNQSALDAHAASANTKRYRDELQPISGSPLDERVYQVVE